MGDEWRMWFWCLFLPSTKKCDNFDENCRLSIAQTVSNTYINHGVAMVLLAKSNILPRSLRCFRKPVIPFDSAGSTPQQPSISFRHELENTHFFLACWNWGCDMMEDKTSITNKYIQICTFDFVSPKNMEIRSCWTPFVCFQSVPFSHFSIGFARAVPPEEFLAFPKTTGAEIRIVLGMLYGVKAVGHWVWVNFHKLPTDSQRSEGESIV